MFHVRTVVAIGERDIERVPDHSAMYVTVECMGRPVERRVGLDPAAMLLRFE